MRNEDDISDPDDEVPAPARSLGIHPPAPALNSAGWEQSEQSAAGHGNTINTGDTAQWPAPHTMTLQDQVANTIREKKWIKSWIFQDN